MRIEFSGLSEKLYEILLKRGTPNERALLCSRIFTETTRDGVNSHGVNRFPRFVSYIDDGYIDVNASPILEGSLGALEKWDGAMGIGNTNAWNAMERAIELAEKYGIGAVALRNTNHWMRGGTYGLQAAQRGFVGICFTNTMPNMPAWGAASPCVGNNPLVFAIPHGDTPVLTDAAMSQYSYGALERARLEGRELDFIGGYDEAGELTRNPGAIEKSMRLLPTGYWKGSAFSVALDLICASLSDGNAVCDVSKYGEYEVGLSQVFIAVSPSAQGAAERTREYVESFGGRLPGDGMYKKRAENMKSGIYVEDSVWEKICSL